jgi:lambda family phage portal protein
MLQSPDAALLPEQGTLVARAVDLTRNNGLAAGARQTYIDNVIGAQGLRLASRPMYKLLGQSKDWQSEFSNTVEQWFGFWGGDSCCDVLGEQDFGETTRAVAGSLWLSGEALALPHWNPTSGNAFATQILLVDPARISNPNSQSDNATLRAGFELDKMGRTVAVHVRNAHPGDRYGWGNMTGAPPSWERIPMRTDWGRKQVIYVSDKDRIGSTRGKPALTSIMKEFKMLSHYGTVELQTAIANALISAFVTTPLDTESLVELLGGADETKKYLDGRPNTNAKLKGGAVIPLRPGEDIKPFVPGRAGASFQQFVDAFHHTIAAGLNIPRELLLKDFSRTNYSSARAALLEAWRYFLAQRARIAKAFCQPVFELVLEEMVDKGLVQAPDFYTLRRAYTAARWIGAGRGWVDEVKEATAAKLRMDSALSTLESECATQGQDWEEVLEQRAIEAARMKELGLTPTPPAQTTVHVGNEPPEEPAQNGAATNKKDPSQDKTPQPEEELIDA